MATLPDLQIYTVHFCRPTFYSLPSLIALTDCQAQPLRTCIAIWHARRGYNEPFQRHLKAWAVKFAISAKIGLEKSEIYTAALERAAYRTEEASPDSECFVEPYAIVPLTSLLLQRRAHLDRAICKVVTHHSVLRPSTLK